MNELKISVCTPQCMHSKSTGAIYQNEKYGNKRVFNPCPGEKSGEHKWRCTVCGELKGN